MKKRIQIFSILLLLSAFSHAQWQDAGAVYQPNIAPSVEKMISFNGKLYACGRFQRLNSDTVNNIVAFDSSNWSALSTGLSGAAFAMAVYNNELIVAGEFNKAGNVNATRIAKWDGTNWSTIGAGLPFYTNPSPSSLCVYNGNLYVGGGYGIQKWDGTNWSRVFDHGAVKSLVVYNNELIAAGAFDSIPGFKVNKICKYNGSSWTALGSGLIQMQTVGPFTVNVADIRTMMVHNNTLFVGGSFETAGSASVRNLAKWNGTDWADVGGGVNSTVSGLESDGTNLYVLGFFWKIGSSDASGNRAASWNGTSFTVMGTEGAGGGTSAVIYKNQLYGGGNLIARWKGALSQNPTNGLIEIKENDFLISPNPTHGVIQIQKSSESSFDINVMDITGRIIYQANSNQNLSIDLSQQKAGTYFIRISDKESVSIKKIILQ